MKPGAAPISSFDLAVIPRHDSPRRAKNVVVTEGAPNLINPDKVSEKIKEAGLDSHEGPAIGLLLGGDNKRFRLTPDLAEKAAERAMELADKLGGQLFVTTSRRTSTEIETLLEKRLSGYPRCKQLILANRKNPPGTVEAILSKAQILVISAESISMISEAASCGNKLVLAFEMEPRTNPFLLFMRIFRDRHKAFLKNLSAHNHIVLVKPHELSETGYNLWQSGKSTERLKDTDLIYEAIQQKSIA